MSGIIAVAIDDEYPALQLIKSYCNKIEQVHLMATFQNPLEALSFLKNNKVDLLILDINMPYLSGIQLLETMPYQPMCIFQTLETQYAVKAFELDVIQYLVKPYDFETFSAAIAKAFDYFEFKNHQNNKNYLVIKSNYIMNKVQLSDILWIEGSGEYINVITPYKKFLVFERMSQFENEYSKLGFVRIHKSYIVLINHIESYNSQHVILKDHSKLPLGRTYKDNLKARLTL